MSFSRILRQTFLIILLHIYEEKIYETDLLKRGSDFFLICTCTPNSSPLRQAGEEFPELYTVHDLGGVSVLTSFGRHMYVEQVFNIFLSLYDISCYYI